MKTRDNGNCEFCGKDLTGEVYEQTHTKCNHDFCNYECLSSFYCDDIPEEEDFIIVAD